MPISKVQQVENFLPDKYLYEVQIGIYNQKLLIVALEPLAKKINDVAVLKSVDGVINTLQQIGSLQPAKPAQPSQVEILGNAAFIGPPNTPSGQQGDSSLELEKDNNRKIEELKVNKPPTVLKSEVNINTQESVALADLDSYKKQIFGKALGPLVVKEGVESIFGAANPIKIYDSDQKLSKILARVYFCTETLEVNQSRPVSNFAGELVICFTREGSSTTDQRFAPDLALIVRIYLLSAISKLKTEMRDCLKELAGQFAIVGKININNHRSNNDTNSAASTTYKNRKYLGQRIQRLMRRFKQVLLSSSKVVESGNQSPERDDNVSTKRWRYSAMSLVTAGWWFAGHFLSVFKVGKLLNLMSDHGGSTSTKKWSYSTKKVVATIWWLVEHFLSVFVKVIIGNFQCLILLWTTVILVIAGLFWGLLGPINGYQGLSIATVSILKITLVAQVGLFALLALNFKNIEDRVHDKILENANFKLGKILSELTQTNANVASLNTIPEPAGHVPEMLLRHFDEVLHVKDAVTGLEKVILARQRNVAAQVSHVKEHQERARRAATAAAGGVFTGFFTFEVGERVFKFMHLIHGQDDRSMFFWLTTEAGHFTNPDLVNTQKRLPPELLESYKNCIADGGKSCTTVQQTLGPGQIREHFLKHYQQSEMHAYGVLLAITLVVSLIAAAIGWRKPAEEQAGGHGGHH